MWRCSATGLFYVQGDGTLLVQSQDHAYDDVRTQLLTFAELVQRMDPIHVYQVRPVSLWQAAALGRNARQVLMFLRRYAAHPLPYALQQLIVQEMAKWGQLTLQRGARNRMVLCGHPQALAAVRTCEAVQEWLVSDHTDHLVLRANARAQIKRALASSGWPVCDHVGYQASPAISLEWSQDTVLRPYQVQAVAQFMQGPQDQSGVIVLPCGAGKTLVGIGIVREVGQHALILTPHESSAEQWRREILTRTTLTPNDVSLYQPDKPLTPITIATYHRVAARKRSGERVHLRKLTSYPWGIVVYDEVHMLPAPLFRLAADLQSARRLGLTATLVREDGAEGDVFSLIGNKVFEVPWKQLESQGYLAAVRCVEVRVPMPEPFLQQYRTATAREQHRLSALNPAKTAAVKAILSQHRGESIMVIGHYLESLRDLARALDCPLVTGQTPQDERQYWLQQFRDGRIHTIVLSRIANMAIDVPCASVAIQVSGLFGSRQEEAQRLGRLLRPKTQEGVFYTLISQSTVEEKAAQHRQLYLVEQGYAYSVLDVDDVLAASEVARPIHEEEAP